MSLYENWLKMAYDQQTGATIKKVWSNYLPLEQKIYTNMLTNKKTSFLGSLSELAKEHDMTAEFFLGFLDGINGALEEELDIPALAEDSEIDAKLKDFETLYKKMVEYKANHLVQLPEWDDVFTKEQRETFYREQKSSGTIVKGDKTGRNDPCPCGSGKKYKKCCGTAE